MKGHHVHIHTDDVPKITQFVMDNYPEGDVLPNYMDILKDNQRGYVWSVKDYSRFGFKFRNEQDMNLFLLQYGEYFKRKPKSWQRN